VSGAGKAERWHREGDARNCLEKTSPRGVRLAMGFAHAGYSLSLIMLAPGEGL
jgi:hypothetical protein